MVEHSDRQVAWPSFVGLVVAVLTAWIAACDDAASRRDAPVLRDSAHITIAENPGPDARVPEWTLGDSPLLTVGRDEPHPLFRVVGAARLDNGHIVVANAGTSEVLFFGPDGDLLRAAGGEGGGPGEYVAVGSLVKMPGDTLVLYDTSVRSLTRLAPGGEVLGTVTLALPDPENDLLRMAFMRLAGYLGHGLVFVAPVVRHTGMTSPGRVAADTFKVFMTEAVGTRAREIAAIPGTDTWVRSYTPDTGGRVLIEMPVPFGAAVQSAAGGGRFFLGRSDRYEITAYGESGDPELLIRRPSQRRPVTATDRTAFENDYLAEAQGVDRYLRVRQRLLQEVPFAATHPEFAELAATEQGALWVKEPAPPGADTATWAIYGPDGLLDGRVRTPAELKIEEIGADFLLGLHTDDLGVERIELWALRPLGTGDG